MLMSYNPINYYFYNYCKDWFLSTKSLTKLYFTSKVKILWQCGHLVSYIGWICLQELHINSKSIVAGTLCSCLLRVISISKTKSSLWSKFFLNSLLHYIVHLKIYFLKLYQNQYHQNLNTTSNQLFFYNQINLHISKKKFFVKL